jgi:hypothetical protein
MLMSAKSFWVNMLSLGSRGRILTETTSSLKENMTELWILSDLLPYFPVSDFSIWGLLQEKVQAAPHANLAALCESITKEWDWLPLILPPPGSHH